MASARQGWVGCGGLAKESDVEVSELLELLDNPTALYVCSIDDDESKQLFLANPDNRGKDTPDMCFYEHEYMRVATNVVESLSSMYGVSPALILSGIEQNLMDNKSNP